MGAASLAVFLSVMIMTSAARAQPAPAPPGLVPHGGPGMIVQEFPINARLELDPQRSRLVRTGKPVKRIAITDPRMLEVTQFRPNELELLGRRSGETTLTLWFAEPDGSETVLRYLVRIAPDRSEQRRAEIEFGNLQRRINEMFPGSQVQLIPLLDKLIVRGQARGAEEATKIMAVLRGQAITGTGNVARAALGGRVAQIPGALGMPAYSVINMLDVPGEQQVMLKVRIAELTRSALRDFGVDVEVVQDNLSISHFVGGGGNITAILDAGDVDLFVRAFASNGSGKILAEPTLVTLSGQTATFIAGGQFAVPTVVGVDGVGAATTQFQGFGTQLSFTPTVLDKDRVRLQVAPSFSTLNQGNAVQGIPGLDTRAVTTTVDLREGQWLAIAGLIQDEQGGSRSRLPFLGDIPVVGGAFGSQSMQRNETELVVLVSPELVHPLEAKQVPLILPGMDVTEPTDKDFFLHQMIEGAPSVHHRSTVWPLHRQKMRAELKYQKKRQAAMQHVKRRSGYQRSQNYYIQGPFGFSQ